MMSISTLSFSQAAAPGASFRTLDRKARLGAFRPAPGKHLGAQLRVQSSSRDDAEAESEIPDSLPALGVDSDWREYRAKLVASTSGSKATESGRWAHELPGPEPGCVLLAHPLMFVSNQTYFSHAVILIHEHTPEYTAGIILNKPTRLTVGEATDGTLLSPEFDDNSIYLGGDVGHSSLHLLHSKPDLDGSIQVSRGVYYGGFEQAKAAVAEGRAKADEFRWFTRYAGWGPGQLDSECERQVWFCASVAPELILDTCEGTGRGRWHEILDLMGGDHAELSAIIKAEYGARKSDKEE